jgi:hypothetical protein
MGRRKLPEARVGIATRVKPETLEILKAEADEKRKTLSSYVADLLDDRVAAERAVAIGTESA